LIHSYKPRLSNRIEDDYDKLQMAFAVDGNSNIKLLRETQEEIKELERLTRLIK
jgi:hypothetical protein